ncbi:chromate transporter [Brevibacillus laterosporus]|uniref:chromate transporter n=1 Tax=Brevibacillus TaxID=55080 RepID=UPI001AFF35EF|nr:chromate transporter [Brevibacillus halotolerans]GIO02716.1 putative transporter YwrB [Brevibacillus halotolerans]
MVYWQLFLAFFRIGIFGYGGGPTMIPLVHAECVKKYKWVSKEEFADNYALGNTLPGPIATKMAAYIGYKVKGWLGAIIAISAMVFPVLFLMVVLMQFVNVLKTSETVRGMIEAIQPVIAVMMAVMTYDFFKKGWKDSKNGKEKQGFLTMLFISVIALVPFQIHPGLFVAITLVIAFAYSTWHTKRQKNQQQN